MAKRQIPEVLTAEEQQLLMSQPNPRYPTGERNRAMIRVMLDLGLRVAEVAALKWRYVDLMTGKVQVKEGKGKKDRVLWAGKGVLELLRSGKERQAGLLDNTSEFVFTTLKGQALSPWYIQKMVKRYSTRAGIEKPVTPHTLRHTFATDLLRVTRNLRVVQKALGHASISTTQIYTHIVDDELEDALKNFRETA